MTKSEHFSSGFKRFSPAFIVFALLIPTLLSACSGTSVNTGIPTVPSSPTRSSAFSGSTLPVSSAPSTTKKPSDELFDAVEPADFGGGEFRIAAYNPKTVFPSSAGDFIDDLVLERNLKTETRFNVKLNLISYPANDFFNPLKTDYYSGLPGCDLVVAPADMLDLFVTFSMYTNVNTLGVDFSKPCYNKSAMDAMSTGAVTYAAAGSFTDSPENSYCVFLNRTLLKNIGGDDPALTVLNGTWTWSALNSLSQAAAEKDFYGLCSSVDDKNFINLLWASTGVHFFTNDPPQNPQIALDSTVASNITKLISSTMTSSAYCGDRAKQSKSAGDLFADGESLFYIARISQYASLVSSGMNVGVLPLPKSSEQQSDYSSYLDNTFQVTYVPVNCPDKLRAGVILDALSASSFNMVKNACLSLYMHLYLSSNDEALIVNKIFESQFFDIGFILGSVYNQFASASYDMIYRAVTADASLSTMIRQNKTQFSRFLTEKIFDHAIVSETSTSAPATSPVSAAPVAPPVTSAAAVPNTVSAPPGTSSGSAAPQTTAPNSTSSFTAPYDTEAPFTSFSLSTPDLSSTASASTVPASSIPGSSESPSTEPSSSAPPTEHSSTAPDMSDAGESQSVSVTTPASSPAQTDTSASDTAAQTSQVPESTSPSVSDVQPVSSEAPAYSAQPQASNAPSQTVPAD